MVDNNSPDTTADAIASEHPWVNLIASKENLGFARGSNLAMKRATGDLLILLNPDTVVHDGALDALVDFLAEHPETGLVGGRLLNGDGSVQWSQRRFPSALRQLSEAMYLHFLFPKSSWSGEIDMIPENYDKVRYPDWLTGAFLAAKRETTDRIGLLDERYFMYCEDTDWCYECWKVGWKVAYVPDAVVTHYGGLSRSTDLGTWYPRLVGSRLRFYRKHYNFGYRLLVRSLLIATMLQRVLLFPFSAPFLKKAGHPLGRLFVSRARGLLLALFGKGA